MKKNILYILLVIILLLVILVLSLLIINLSNRPENTVPPQIMVPEETKEEPQKQIQEPTPPVDTKFSRYGITPREARYYE